MDEYVEKAALLKHLEIHCEDCCGEARHCVISAPPADVVSGEVYRQAIETLEKIRQEANMRFEQAVEAEEALYASNRVEVVRCKNCINSDMIDNTRYCFHWGRNVDDEGFCDKGV